MKITDYELHIRKERKKLDAISNRIINELTLGESDVYRMCNATLIVVLCGKSGSGKTRSIEIANDRLPKNRKIAECHDIFDYKDAKAAFEVLPARYDDAPKYHDCEYVVYSLLDTETGKAMAANYPIVKVIFCENP